MGGFVDAELDFKRLVELRGFLFHALSERHRPPQGATILHGGSRQRTLVELNRARIETLDAAAVFLDPGSKFPGGDELLLQRRGVVIVSLLIYLLGGIEREHHEAGADRATNVCGRLEVIAVG